MEPTIQEILRNHSVKGVRHTHVSMGSVRGKYEFNRQDLEEFWKEYMYLVKNGNLPLLGIAEKPQHYLPVLGDIDIKIRESEDLNVGDKIHTDEHVHMIIEIYQSILRKIVDGCTDEHLVCVLLEKPLYRIIKNGVSYAKHGFHIHFVNCFLNRVDQEIHLIPRVQEMAKNMKVFQDIGFEDSGLLIDKSCATVPWLMYGSRKEDGMEPYLFSKIFDANGNEMGLEKALGNYKLFDMREQLISIRGKVKEYLPRILSIIPYGRDTCEVRHGLPSPLKEQMKERKENNKEYKKTSVTEALAVATSLLPMLSDFRAEDRNEWMNIGWILYNIGNGCPEALDLWCQFSSRCENSYDEAVCLYQWERMTKKDLTLGTLRYYAGVDNPERYKEFKNSESEKHVKESLNGSHNDVAKILYAIYGDQFVCASITSKTWFEFRGHKWELIEDGVFLREKISGEIVEKFTAAGRDLFTELGKSKKEDTEEGLLNSRVKQVQKMISNLKSAPYKNNVMKEAMEVFYDRRFLDKLDNNPLLFPFNNGVFDLSLNIFRPGRPEDFISKCSPIDYMEFSEDDEKVHFVYDYLEKVFPDKSLRQYFMDVASDVFLGGNHQKIVVFWTGDGDNAKSVTQGIFEKMLGPLAIKFNTTVITGKKVQSGSANPELARAGGGVRWAVLEEPNSDEVINIGILKNLSGNDSYYARDLFEKGKGGREITPMFKLIFICNKLPKLLNSDKATWNRIRVIPFESTFCRPDDPAPETYEEQLRQKRFPMDKSFGEKIPGMLQAFAWVLLKHRQNIKVRVEPDKVRSATAGYRKDNDIYRQFEEENIIADGNGSLTVVELYSWFKDWFRDGMPNQPVPVKSSVEEHFSKSWGEPTSKGKKWKGYRIKTEQDDVDSGDIVLLEDDDLADYSNDRKYLPPM